MLDGDEDEEGAYMDLALFLTLSESGFFMWDTRVTLGVLQKLLGLWHAPWCPEAVSLKWLQYDLMFPLRFPAISLNDFPRKSRHTTLEL